MFLTCTASLTCGLRHASRIWVLILLMGPGQICQAEVTTVMLTATQVVKDPRTSYAGAVLALALEKTRSEYGDFRIQNTPVMNTARALLEIKANRIANQLIVTSFQNKMLDDGLRYANFPIEYGVTGYRVCFVSPNAKEAVRRAKKLADLQKFTIGQGSGWADVAVLRHSGFKVEELSNHESGYLMVASNRIDLYCRGINEAMEEWQDHANVTGLTIDSSMALRYPLPRFYISNQKNSALLERISKGLHLAHQDGSLQKEWRRFYAESVSFVKLKNRRIFNLSTPNIDRIDFDYRKYFINPEQAMSAK
ncbi:hypothetical protein [Uliginosibacterium gangwonense]|uniref:hypothetical protein n=1 Tax=Uliginosibacterium gangwonense TaxID=392736 RepID=UPI00035E0926|nr:hypothetical protein [Uliginosibacterium gangwonense]